MVLPLCSAGRSILEPLLERRASSGARVEDLPLKEDTENRISKFKRKDWSLSKSQVIAEKASEPDLMVKNKRMNEQKRGVGHANKQQRFASAFPRSRAHRRSRHSWESPGGSPAVPPQDPAACGNVRS